MLNSCVLTQIFRTDEQNKICLSRGYLEEIVGNLEVRLTYFVITTYLAKIIELMSALCNLNSSLFEF